MRLPGGRGIVGSAELDRTNSATCRISSSDFLIARICGPVGRLSLQFAPPPPDQIRAQK